ncbi:hypothetical protein C8R43DRAFT_176973 [Mycena crocata]|nr:hypothetical protein C8R43DRAFT_176973 [Mycena crocata]
MDDSEANSPLNSPAESLAPLPPARPLRRCRTSSSLFSPSSSSSKLTLDLPSKAVPSVYLTVRTGKHTAFGAFSPTPDAHSALQFFTTPTRRRPSIVHPTPVPVRAQTVPSISRTASSFSISDLSPSTSPSPASSLLDFDRDYTPRPSPSRRGQDPTPPALASVEKRSRISSKRMLCATCRAPGTNFPACGRCGSAWCSRSCRLPNGVRHVCAGAPPQLSRTGISSTPLAIISSASE